MEIKEKVFDYEVIEDISLLEKSQLIIYGVSSNAERFWPIIKNYNIVGISDGDVDKVGNIFHGYKIEGFKELNNRLKLKEVIVIVLSVYAKDIIEFCLSISDEIKGFITLFGLQYTCLINKHELRLNVEERNKYKKAWERKIYVEKQWIISNYRALYYRNLLSFANTDSILVYTIGKVASSAIISGLSEYGCEVLRMEGFAPYLYYIWDDDEIKACRELISCIINEKKKIRIITCIRDPIARDISSLMYVLPEKLWQMGFISENIHDIEEGLEKYINTGLLNTPNLLLSNCGYDSMLISNMSETTKADILRKRGNRHSIFTFFQLQLKDIFGIDVFAYPFDKERGFSIISSGNIECLVLKQEKIGELESVIREFTGCNEFVLKETNSAQQRLSGYVYYKMMKRLVVPDVLLEWYYSNESMRHFYSEHEISELIAKWGKNFY